MKRFIAIGALSAAAISSVAISAPAKAAPLDNVTISVVAFAGSGCQPGTAVAAISPDREAVTVIYSEYLVQLPSNPQRNCTISLRINIPGGLSFTIVSADYYGFKIMRPGSSGSLWTRYRFQGGPIVSGTTSLSGVTGAQGANWQTNDTLGALTWSVCGESRLLIADSRLTIGGSSTQSLITMDSTDISFSTVFHLQWRPC